MESEFDKCQCCGVTTCKRCGTPVVVVPKGARQLVLDAEVMLITTTESGHTVTGYTTDGRAYGGRPHVPSAKYPIGPMPVQQLHRCKP